MLLLSVKEVIASSSGGFDSIAGNGDNRDFFWANLMAQPRSNGFQRQWMRDQSEQLNSLNYPPLSVPQSSVNENNNKPNNAADINNRPYYQVSASTRQIYPNSYRVFKPKPFATSNNAEKQPNNNNKLDSQQEANSQSFKYNKNARSGNNVGFDSMVFEAPINAEKPSASNFYIGDDYSPSHKRANLLKLANQAARGFGRKWII